jgi:hypothetical protein
MRVDPCVEVQPQSVAIARQQMQSQHPEIAVAQRAISHGFVAGGIKLKCRNARREGYQTSLTSVDAGYPALRAHPQMLQRECCASRRARSRFAVSRALNRSREFPRQRWGVQSVQRTDRRDFRRFG